jgi:hypothetical protein
MRTTININDARLYDQIEAGEIQEVHTNDSDFSRFPGIPWVNPL